MLILNGINTDDHFFRRGILEDLVNLVFGRLGKMMAAKVVM